MLEDVLQIRVLNAHAGIADVDFDNGAIGGARLYVDRAWTGHAGGDGIASVHQHVENHLAQLDGIPQQRREVLRRRDVNRDVLVEQVVAQQAQDVPDQRVHVQRRVLRVLLAEERAQPDDGLAGAAGVRGDVRERLAHLTGMRRVGWQHSDSGLRIGQDGRERLAELVRDRGRQLAERGQPQRVRELVALPLELLLGMAPPFIGLDCRQVGAPALRQAHQQRHQQRALQENEGDARDDIPLVGIPQRRGAELYRAPRRQPLLVDPPALQLPPVEDILVIVSLQRWNGGRRLAAEDAQADFGRVPPVVGDAVDMPAERSETDVLIERHVDRGAGDLGDARERLVGDERPARAVGEKGEIDDRAARRQSRDPGQQLVDRQPGEIADPDPVLERFKLAPRDREEPLVESGRAADHDDLVGVGLQPQRDGERGSEGPLHQDAGDVGGGAALDVGGVDDAEDDRHAGEQGGPMPEQEIQRWLHHCYDQIEMLPGVLEAEMIAKQAVVPGVVEAGEVQ